MLRKIDDAWFRKIFPRMPFAVEGKKN